jgi:hypothetical protein
MSSHRSHKSCRKYILENGANMDLKMYQKRDQMPRSKHPLLTSHTRRKSYFQIDQVNGTLHSQDQCVLNE